MAKRLMALSALINLFVVVYAYEPLDSVFNNLRGRSEVMDTEVQYSGTFSDGGPGFMFQRGAGRGWTKGPRLTVGGVEATEAKKVQRIFEESEPVTDWVSRNKEGRATFDEAIRVGYAMDYDPATHTLYFLRVNVEDEICIPMDWTTRNYYNAPSHKPARKREQSVNVTAALARLYTELKYNSPFYPAAAERIDQVYESLVDTIGVVDDYTAFRMLEQLAAACGDGHTFIYGSTGDRPVWSPFKTVLLGDRLFVESVENKGLASKGMKRGMEIIAVNGESPLEYARRELQPYVSSSTPQWTDHRMFDGNWFSLGRKGSPLNLTLTADGGKTTIEIAHKIGEQEGENIPVAWPRPSFAMEKGDIAVLTLPDFATRQVTEFFDSVYPEIQRSKGLIIDLRGNEGGNSGFADYILRHFTADSIARGLWSSPIYVPAFASWNRKTPAYESDAEKMPPIEDVAPYLGEVVLLTDRGTYSAAEDFCSVFRGMKRGLIVGTPTGGSTGNSVRVPLGYGLTANICSKHDRMPDGTEFVGIGIIPDVEVAETPETFFSTTKDAAKDAALKFLRRKK